jgi:hypothetical protein
MTELELEWSLLILSLMLVFYWWAYWGVGDVEPRPYEPSRKERKEIKLRCEVDRLLKENAELAVKASKTEYR